MSTFFKELVRAGIYKRSQGRITRQVTFAAVAIAISLGLWQLADSQSNSGVAVQYGVPAALLASGFWCTYRVVNVPGVADFLIAVEAEMNKVSWPTRPELIRASLVVLVTIFALATILFSFDYCWKILFQVIGIG